MNIKSIGSRMRHGAALTLILAGTVLGASADDSSVIKLPLQNTGVDPDATGTMLSLLKPRSSIVSVKAARLTPGQTYTLTVGDTPEATLIADRNGRITSTFSTKPKKNKPRLDFDPRGQLVALREGSNSVLEAMVSGPGEPGGIAVDERARLTRLSGSGEATARYQVLRNGRRIFTVKIERAEPGDWSLYVNGIFRGAIPVSGRQTTVTFDSNPAGANRRLLDFDPRSQVVDLALGTNLNFTGKLEARANDVNVAAPSFTQTFLPSTGIDPDGTARARYRIDPDARRKFSVELEDVPAGAYELIANDARQGVINVVATANGTRGEIEFSSREDDGNEQPLNFDPATATFTVQSGGVVYFQGRLAGAGVGGSTNSNGNGAAPDSFAGLTLNLDDQPGGDLMQFDTATSGVDLGTNPDPFSYLLTRLNASQVRVDIADGDKLDVYVFTFSSASAGSWVRDEYRDGAFKDRDTGPFTIVGGTNPGSGGTNGNPGSTNAVIFPGRTEVPLFNLGVTPNASAKAGFKTDDRGRRSFEVEIEDAPVGGYALWIGDAQVATLTVTTRLSGTHGEIEFEDDDNGTHRPLTFNPLGQLITIRRDGTDYFQRVFPAGN